MRSRILLALLVVVLLALLLTGYLLGGRARLIYRGAGRIVALRGDDSGLVWLQIEAGEASAAGRIFALGEGSRSAQAIYSEPRAVSLALSGDRVLALATDGESGELLSIPRSGGQPKTIASGLSRPAGLCADGGAVYWTETDAARLPHVWHIPLLLPRTVIRRGSIDGQGDPQALAAIEAAADGFVGSLLGLYGERLYWIDVSGATASGSWSAIRSVPSTGGSVELLVRERGFCNGVLEGDTLHWTAPSQDAGNPLHCCSIRRASVPDGPPVTLTDWLTSGGSLCRCGKRLYYVAVDGLWTVPERLSLPRQIRRSVVSRELAAGWRGAVYEVVPVAEGEDGLLRRPLTAGARLRAAVGLL